MIDKLLLYMKEEGVKMTHIAKMIGYSNQHLNNVLKGEKKISVEMEKRIAEFLKSKGRL